MLSGGPIGGDLLARRYRLIDRVGAGGMSVVWRARDEVLDRLVAVKWLGSELADDQLFRDLVRREAWATARIKHPAVAAVYDYGEVSGGNGESLAYVVMEMLDGESLASRLRHGRLPWRESVAICAEVADALATAHEHGVVHRDISPDNVMLTSSGLRVFDFGIAAPIGEPDDDATGSTFGTPAYVAPERLDGQPAQTATDVYALGVLLFEMLTGDPPFPEDTWNPSAALTDRVPPRLRGQATAGLPPAVARLTRSCLAYDPARRPPAREVADRLAAYARPWWRGHAIFATVAAAAVVVAAVVAVAGSIGSASAPAATTPPAVAGALPTVPSASPPPASASASAPAPVGPTPADAAGPTSAPPVPLSPAHALDQLRQILVTGQADGAIRSDVAQDLHNQVESIGTTLTLDPTSATLVQKIDSLRAHVLLRSTEQWGGSADLAGDPSRPSIAPACRDAMLAAIDTLKTAIMTA